MIREKKEEQKLYVLKRLQKQGKRENTGKR